MKHETDEIGYAESDSGCKYASRYLGRQSHCYLLDEFNNEVDVCPFYPIVKQCIWDMEEKERALFLSLIKCNSHKKVERNMEIIRMDKEGISRDDISDCTGLLPNSITRIISKHYQSIR